LEALLFNVCRISVEFILSALAKSAHEEVDRIEF
jgi:hypothetical protein